MFCADCGIDLGEPSAACPKCGREPQRAGGATAAQLGSQVKASSRDAATALRSFGVDPVGGLAPAFGRLGPERGAAAGIALCIVFALASALGVTLGARRWFGFWADVAGMSGGGAVLKIFFLMLVLPAAFTACGLAARKLLGARSAGAASDVFTAGAALAPLGLATLVGGLLGMGNLEIAALLYLFALSYLVLLLYAGLTGLAGVSARAAAPVVPVTIVAAGWLSKVAFAALF